MLDKSKVNNYEKDAEVLEPCNWCVRKKLNPDCVICTECIYGEFKSQYYKEQNIKGEEK